MDMAEATEKKPIWEYVSLADYQVPTDTVKRTVSTRLLGFARKLGLKKAAKEPEHPPDDLKPLERRRLDRAAPVPSWRDAAGALNETVTEALSDHASSQSAALVGAPFSGHAETLSVLAETAGWRLIAPPGPEQVLAGDARWIDTFAQGSAPWAMPMLERCFLRHAKGLDLIRRLLEAYVAGRLGRGVLGCGSWGWSFLQKACAETDAIQAVTSQALDARRLRRWFSDLACRNHPEGSLRFRLAGQEGDLLVPGDPATDDEAPTDRFFTHLAAHGRGIPGVAWSVWRRGLRQDNPDVSRETSVSKHAANAPVIRVLPWNALELPSLPSVERPCGAFLLHALLVHNGLPEAILPELLAHGKGRITQMLVQLRSADIIEYRNKRWWITPLAYPAVRAFLRAENYLTDSM